MDKEKKITIISVIMVSVITVEVIVAFSIPLVIFLPLGEFLFPGDGLWNIDEEIAQEETISAPNLSYDVIV
ncbi:MAG: hypothetical protein HZR80_10490 [Candidatus Heimdallarchaeota archaeon]